MGFVLKKASEAAELRSFIAISLLIFLAALSRLLPHPPNFSPASALFLCGAFYLPKKWQAISVPLIAMLISDAFLGFYPDMPAVYLSFLLITLAARALRHKLAFGSKIAFSFVASGFFFLITNTAYFLVSKTYPQSAFGYLLCLEAGLPFWRQSLAADLIYGTFLFGAAHFVWAKASSKALAIRSISSSVK